jgi:hypothetical protein
MACPVSAAGAPPPRVADEQRAIEKLDAVIQSTRLARPSLDSIPKMAVEAGRGLALASPSNNVLGWPKGLPSEQMESPANETLPISPEPVDALHRGGAGPSLTKRDHVAG